ncbi:MAG: PspC domain-containing protein [Butyrivibrio sp.]|nr:PspC domain-containing protein [Butyrivibrio sp.]
MEKKLYRSNDRKLFGVCGGVAEYFNIDPTVVRIIWLVLTFTAGGGAVLYLIAALLMENRPDYVSRYEDNNNNTVN